MATALFLRRFVAGVLLVAGAATATAGTLVVPGQAEVDAALLGPGDHRQRVDGAALAAAGRSALVAWLQTRAERFDVAAAPAATIELPAGELSIVGRPMPAGQSMAARMQVWVDVFIAGRHERAVPVTFSVHAYRDAWVALRDAHVEEPVAGVALQRRVLDIAQERSEPLVDVPPGARLRKVLLAGQALTAAHVEATPAIVRGSTVTLRSALGTIGIEARAEALQDGQPGQQVWVRVASSTGPVRARVIDVGSVELDHE